MKDFNKVVLELADDMQAALMKHKPTPEIAFACIGSLVLELTQNLCANLHSEEPAHTTVKFLNGVAKHIAANAKQFANAKLQTKEELKD